MGRWVGLLLVAATLGGCIDGEAATAPSGPSAPATSADSAALEVSPPPASACELVEPERPPFVLVSVAAEAQPESSRTSVRRASPPRSHGPSRVVSRGRGDRRAVTLTFDAGADRGHAAAILDILAREHVPAAFGITGQWAESNPDLLRRVVNEGHDLINHSYDHASFTGASWPRAVLTAEARAAQLSKTERIFRDLAGASEVRYFRPPFGDYDASVLSHVGSEGYVLTVMWSVDSWGWRGLAASEIARRSLDLATPGAILIFHVGASSQDAVALPAVIEGLRGQGYEFATLAALLDVSP